MEVINNGNEKTFITQCERCRSDLRWTRQDIFEKSDMPLEYIQCPVCKTQIIVGIKQE